MTRIKGFSIRAVVGALALAGVFAMPRPVDALTLTGTLDVNGGVRVEPTLIDFTPVGGGTGLENIANTSTFTVNGTLVTPCANCVVAKDLDQTLFPVSGFTTFLNDYEELAQFPNLNFQLQDILSCAEVGGLCPVQLGADSPFGFVQGGGGTTVTFVAKGQVWDTTEINGNVYNFTATYTAQFTGQTINEVLFAFNPACVPGVPIPGGVQTCGFIDTSFSASKITVLPTTFEVVPEPATLLLLGSGLVAAAARSRRRKVTTV